MTTFLVSTQPVIMRYDFVFGMGPKSATLARNKAVLDNKCSSISCEVALIS